MAFAGDLTIASESPAISTVSVAEGLVYSGSCQSPSLTVQDSDGNEVASSVYEIAYYDQDRNRVGVDNLVDAGSYSIEVTPKEGSGYSGSATNTFTIAQKELTMQDVAFNSKEVRCDYVPSAEWVNPGVWTKKASTRVSGIREDGCKTIVSPKVSISYGGVDLVQDIDYEIVVNDSVRAIDLIGENAEPVTVEYKVAFKGNYSGTLASDELKVTVDKRSSRIFTSEEGVKLSYAVVEMPSNGNPGKAVITGLGADTVAGAFSGWKGEDHEKVIIPGSFTSSDGDFTVTEVADCAFNEDALRAKNTRDEEPQDDLNGATKLVLGEGIEVIGYNAFKGDQLKEIQLPETLKVIHGQAFGSTHCADIVIPKNVQTIGVHAFGWQHPGCEDLMTFKFEQPSSFKSTDDKYYFITEASGKIIQRAESTGQGGFLSGRGDGENNAPLQSFLLPAGLEQFGSLVSDCTNCKNYYFMQNNPESSSIAAQSYAFGITGMISGDEKIAIWGWDVQDSNLAQSIASASGSDPYYVYRSYAVLKDGYTYQYGWDVDAECCTKAIEYPANITGAAEGLKAVQNGDKVAVADWGFTTAFQNEAGKWTPVEGTDFIVEYTKDGETSYDIPETGTYDAKLIGVGSILFKKGAEAFNDDGTINVDAIAGEGDEGETLPDRGEGASCFGTMTVQVTYEGTVLAEGAVSIDEDGYDAEAGIAYTGEAIEPAVAVKATADGNELTLESGKDYDVVYADNTLPGTATVTVTGKGNYSGTASTTFKIAESEAYAADAAAAQALADAIAKLPEASAATAADKAAADDALAAFEKLSDGAKAMVADKTSMSVDEVKGKLDAVKDAADQAAAEKEAADKKAAAAKAKADAAAKAAALAAASNVNKPTFTAADAKKASALGATTITLGPKVKKIAKGAFKGTNIKTIVVKTKKLKKKSVKGSLKGSKVKTVKVQIGKKKVNKKYAKKYKKIFTKKNAGKKAKVKK